MVLLNKGNELFSFKEYYLAWFYYREVITTDSNMKIDWINKGHELF